MNQINEYYGRILRDGAVCAERIKDEVIVFRPHEKAKAEKALMDKTSFEGVFEHESPKAKEKNPFDDIFK